MAAVDIEGLRKSYSGIEILRDLTLHADQHEFVTLLGPSGCGKTTTLRCLAGLERAESGTIRIGGRVVAAPSERVFVAPNHRGIGMVFQSYALWPHMTVFSNVAYPLRVRRSPRPEIRRAVMEMLAAVGMESYAQRHVTDLSGGQQQRVALARAMVAQPELLLFDEPLSNLDAKLRRSMRREIRDAHDRSGATSVYVTHDQEEAISLSDRVIVMRSGVVQQVGEPRQIYHEPANRFVADFIGFDNILSGEVLGTRDAAIGVVLAGSTAPVWTTLGQRHVPRSPIGLAVRAEHLRLVAVSGGEPPTGAVVGRVRTCTYTGENVEYGVDIAGRAILVRRQERGGRVEPGDNVWVTVDAEHCVVVEAEDTYVTFDVAARLPDSELTTPAPVAKARV